MWLIELVFPANLICRSTGISKYFRESRGIRDNESQLYFQDSTCLCPNGYRFVQRKTYCTLNWIASIEEAWESCLKPKTTSASSSAQQRCYTIRHWKKKQQQQQKKKKKKKTDKF